MSIRPAQARDLDACLALDESFETEYVWQMDTTRNNGSIQCGFRTTRLPRAMKVPAQSPHDAIADHFEAGECFLVAEEYPRIVGFLDMTADRGERTAWIHHLVVAPDMRRQGVGKQLLGSALIWAHDRKMRAVIAGITTKNVPASTFLQKFGFAFCGFNDQYYHNRDIALFFSCNLR